MHTIIIEEMDKSAFRARLDTIINRYNKERIFNIDTGCSFDGGVRLFYAIIIVEGNPLDYDKS